jgi:hypothetical protein
MMIRRFTGMTAAAMAAYATAALAGETGMQQQSSGADMSVNDNPAVSAPVCHSSSAAPTCAAQQPCAQSDDLDNNTQMQRLVGVAAISAGGVFVLDEVGGAARDVARFGKVRDIPVYGKAIRNIPVAGKGIPVYGGFISGIPYIGKKAGTASIPTTLGQVPMLGPLVKSVPLVGPVIAGPADPIVVAAVAVDSYIIPKCNPCGYTESSEFAPTDFNNPPKVRSYVNYVAPEPYTHPPIYAPSTINTGRTPNTAPSVAAETGMVNVPE